MEVLFGDGSGGVFTFFKDKGGKMNHMHLRMNVKSKVYARLVYEDGSDIPEMFLNLEDVPLLQMEIDEKKSFREFGVATSRSLRGVLWESRDSFQVEAC